MKNEKKKFIELISSRPTVISFLVLIIISVLFIPQWRTLTIFDISKGEVLGNTDIATIGFLFTEENYVKIWQAPFDIQEANKIRRARNPIPGVEKESGRVAYKLWLLYEIPIIIIISLLVGLRKSINAKREKRRDLATNEKYLSNGKVIKFFGSRSNSLSPEQGNKILVEDEISENGFYRLARNLRWEVRNGKFYKEYYVEEYQQKNGLILEIDGDRDAGIHKGSRAWINDKSAPDGTYKIGWFKKVKIIDGMIC